MEARAYDTVTLGELRVQRLDAELDDLHDTLTELEREGGEHTEKYIRTEERIWAIHMELDSIEDAEQPELALTYTADERMENLLDAERAGERAPEILVFEQRDLRGVSPWVARNLDCAQYAQPRGSQYEG